MSVSRLRTGAVRLLASLAVLSVASCSGSLEQKTYPVTGRVVIGEKPVPGATIIFHPVDKSKFKWQEQPQAKTDADGKFTLFTYKAGDGAPAGDYKVAIAIVQSGDDDGGDQVKRVKGQIPVPDKYGNPDTSGLTAKVEAKSNDLPPFKLDAK